MQEEENTKTIPEMVEEVQAGKMPRRNFIRTLTAMGISAAGVGVIAADAANPRTSKLTPATRLDENVAKNLHLHDQHLQDRSQGNAGALQQDYAYNAVVEDSMYEERFVGHAAIMARKRIDMAAIPDLKINLTNRVAHGTQVIAEWVASGTHTGDLPGFPATGRPFSIRGVTVVVRHDGKIVRESIYYNMDEVRRQLGPR